MRALLLECGRLLDGRFSDLVLSFLYLSTVEEEATTSFSTIPMSVFVCFLFHPLINKFFSQASVNFLQKRKTL